MASELVIKYNPSSRHARGKACLNCRRRKIKCDGEHPICGQCASARGTFDDCEYSDGRPSQAQLLEKKITDVQERINELEEKAAKTLSFEASSESLHPYPLGPAPSPSSISSASSAHSSNHTSTEPVHFLNVDPSTSFIDTRLSLHPFQEPYVEHRSIMLNAFYAQYYHLGLFLIPDRFYQSFLLDQPLGHYSRPTPALINVVYLWGIHLCPSNPGIYDETGFLRSTLHHLTKDLAGSHPHKVIHTVQAEILLSYYYLKNGRLLEGSYHANAALSLSLSAGFNTYHTPQTPLLASVQSSSTNPYITTRMRSIDSTLTSLPPPPDLIDESERIDAFWASVILNNYWVAIQESHSMLFDPLDAKIDTPWPTDSPYDIVPQYCESGNTFRQFIECTTVEGVSIKALHAKSTILLEQATTIHLTAFRTDDMRYKALARLDYLIEQFKTILPLSGGFGSQPMERETVNLSLMIAHTASIRLHLPSSANEVQSRRKCISAAKSIVSLTETMVPIDSDYLQLDPILAVLWIAACEVLMPEVLSAGAGNDDILISFETIVSRVARFSERNSMMKYLIEQFQHKYSARFGSLSQR